MSDSLSPMDCSPPSSSAHGILQVRILEWVAISFSRRSSQPRDWTRIPHTAGGFFTVWTTREAQEYWSVCVCVCVWNHFSHVQLFTTLWTIVCQAPLSMGFSRQEYWSGFPFSSPGDLPNPGIKPGSPSLQAYFLPAELPGIVHKIKLTKLLSAYKKDFFKFGKKH